MKKSRAEKKTVKIWIDAEVYDAYLADVGEADASEIMEKALKCILERRCKVFSKRELKGLDQGYLTSF